MDIVLIGGLWLNATAWDATTPALEAAGHRVAALTLPGQGDGNAAATLDNQLDAVVSAVDAAAGPVLAIGHSAACTLAWLAADRRPEKVARVAMIGGMPSAEGEAYFDGLPIEDDLVRFPGWERFEGPDAADLTPDMRDAITGRVEGVPAAVAQGIVTYTNADRGRTPVTLICPEFSPAEAREWLAGGHMPELETVEQLDYVDIESGHWPMFSKPDELARIINQLAERSLARTRG